MKCCDVIIVGGGAAGLMCAIEAGKRKRSVIVLERSDAVGKKIRISGGGRCNFTNLHTTPDHFITGNRNFHKSALARYQPSDFIRLVNDHGIRYHEKKLGQLFCNGSSEEIISMLRSECIEAGVEILLNCNVSEVEKTTRFLLSTNLGAFECASLVVSTGGLSIPKIGATDFGYRIAKQFGVRCTPLRPALVPLVLGGAEGMAFRGLSGVSIDAIVECGGAAFRENVLFTHRGLSGPAILQISSYWKPGDTLNIDTLPEPDSDTRLPRRFLQKWHEFYAPPTHPSQWTRKETEDFAWRRRHWAVEPSGTEGYGKAEVTAGGIDTNELSSKTMEVNRVPGLFVIGEVVDVTGQLGGFNFQWAWASGFVAGQVV